MAADMAAELAAEREESVHEISTAWERAEEAAARLLSEASTSAAHMRASAEAEATRLSEVQAHLLPHASYLLPPTSCLLPPTACRLPPASYSH